MTTPVRFDIVALDTPDPEGLARFSCDLLGWHVERSDDDWVTIRGDDGTGPGGGARLAFQLAPDLVAPTWPDPAVPQQAHLDLAVDDLAQAGAFAESVGARRVHGPGGGLPGLPRPGGAPVLPLPGLTRPRPRPVLVAVPVDRLRA